MEERILNKASEQFFSFGLRSVTMDELAREMGVSKKTLYRHFADKDQIVERVIARLLNDHKQEIGCCRDAATDAVHEVALQLEVILKIFFGIKPGFFNEVQKYFPEIWCNVMSHEKEALLDGIRQNLEHGVSTGLYRPEIDITITSLFRLNQLRSLFTPSLYEVSYIEVKELACKLTDLYLNAITTVKGKQLINDYSILQLQQ
ncbi:MAG TPA: TetR/AcrR family transcriptional regulator [Sphingobacteriaceae bacterium]